jgi:cytochrome c peroxidase
MNAIPKKFGLLLLGLAGCGKLADNLFCESQGCDWRPGEWQRVAALANPGPPPEDKSNAYVGKSAAQLLGQAFFFDPAFSGQASGVDAINRPAPSSRPAACPPMLGISCASCHDLGRAGIDTASVPGHVSVGAGWTDVNALAVVNAAYRPVVFWNGRADSLWALNAVVAESPTTLNGNRLRTVHQIADRYAGFYQQVFGTWDAATKATIAALPANGKPKQAAFDALPADQKDLATGILVNWAKAIAAYESRLISVGSPFDQFVAEGPQSTRISQAAKRGARLFVGKGACVDCHSGPQLTDEQFHNIGVPQTGTAVPKLEDCPASADPKNAACDCVSGDALKCAPWGAYDGLRRLRTTDPDSPIRNAFLRTGKWSSDIRDTSRQAYIDMPLDEKLKGAWRTPSLRNLALTAPYMHDGRYATLEDVIWHYNTGARNAGPEQVNADAIAPQIKPLMLTEGEVGDLVAFLESLTGAPVPEELTVAPTGIALPTGVGGAGGTACNSSGGAGGAPGAGGAGGGTPNTGMAGSDGGPSGPGSGGRVTGSGGAAGVAGSQAVGAGGIGGSPSGAGGAPGCPPLATFDMTLDGFALNFTNAQPGNIATAGGTKPPGLAVDTSLGSPSPGSLRVEAPFLDYNQYVDVRAGVGPGVFQNWTGYKLHVRVRVLAAGSPTLTLQPYAASYNGTGPAYLAPTFPVLAPPPGLWTDYVVDVGQSAAPYDPSKVAVVGIIVSSGPVPNGSGPPPKPTTAIVNVDTFWLEGSCGGSPSP